MKLQVFGMRCITSQSSNTMLHFSAWKQPLLTLPFMVRALSCHPCFRFGLTFLTICFCRVHCSADVAFDQEGKWCLLGRTTMDYGAPYYPARHCGASSGNSGCTVALYLYLLQEMCGLCRFPGHVKSMTPVHASLLTLVFPQASKPIMDLRYMIVQLMLGRCWYICLPIGLALTHVLRSTIDSRDAIGNGGDAAIAVFEMFHICNDICRSMDLLPL